MLLERLLFTYVIPMCNYVTRPYLFIQRLIALLCQDAIQFQSASHFLCT